MAEPARLPERIKTAEAALIVGVTPRTLRNWAIRGEIPRAALICGVWTFDRQALRNWLAQKERQSCPKDYTDVATYGGAESRLPPGRYAEVYARLIERKHGGATRPGSRR